MKAHFVTFYSPGTFVAEDSTQPIDSWDVPKAKEMADQIVERHGAVPFGFRFTTRARTDNELDSRVVEAGPMHYLNCRVRTLADLEAEANPDNSTLITNMRTNRWDKVVQTVKGWRWTQPLHDGDVVL